MKNKKIQLFFLIFFISFFSFNFTLAQFKVFVFPEIIQDKAKARDVLEYTIRIRNLENNLYHFYTLVKDLGKEKNLDKSTSLAKWVEIFRGRTEIAAGEEKEISLTVKIPSFAKPGNYFAEIIFAQGLTELDAIKKAEEFNMPKLLLNIEVEENIVEKIQIKKFQTEKNIYFGQNIKFKIELENIGNREVEPTGKVIIYDKKGKEIGSLEIEKQKINPGEVKNFEIYWTSNEIGYFKAVLFGEYGKNNEKIFQDTTIFWVVSWKILVLFLILFLILFGMVSWFFIKVSKKSFVLIFKPQKVSDILKK